MEFFTHITLRQWTLYDTLTNNIMCLLKKISKITARLQMIVFVLVYIVSMYSSVVNEHNDIGVETRL